MPLWVGLAVSTGFGLWGAKKQSDAAKTASGQQVASIDQAKAELRPIYEGNVARMNPYAQLGGQALGQLGTLGGYPALPSGPNAQFANAVGRDAQGNPLGPVTADRPPLNMSDPRVAHLARGGSLADPEVRGTPMASIGGGGGSAYGGAPAPTGGGSFGAQMPQMVTLQAPDGEIRQVPAAQAGHFEQAGARRVG